MLDPKQLEDIAAKLASVLPPGVRGLRRELEDNFRAVLRANLERFDLVSRERFDVQAELLLRTQKRLADLEARLARLEQGGAPIPPQSPQPIEPGSARPTQVGEGEL